MSSIALGHGVGGENLHELRQVALLNSMQGLGPDFTSRDVGLRETRLSGRVARPIPAIPISRFSFRAKL